LATEALQAAFKGYSDYLKEAYELGFEVEVAVPNWPSRATPTSPLPCPWRSRPWMLRR